ncbi:vitamin K epoxide reductase family protein [uncultured Bacteroides sp.]|uniref:vitamin K epoxide reductase family protein n=1 Tax=uncultured Bacteroides sp. TaxID=162156 RepID=UPI0032B2FFE3
MTAVDNTGTVLYHYLRALSVKVSRSTVHRLLDTPVGSSMRGISDALDALHIKNEVYQLPPSVDYFTQLEAPFITMLQVDKNPFRVVTKKDDSIVEFGDSERIGVDSFLKKWTGTVLFGEATEETPSDSLYLWKNMGYHLWKYKSIVAILLVLILGFATMLQREHGPAQITYLSTLSIGIIISVAIIYKEQFNERFLERFCRIGEAVDCNEVLHSKGAAITGAGLGELSLLYFAVLFLFCIICPAHFYVLSVICSTIALCFTVYSIIYQSFIIRKGCMLCMLVNITIWSIAIELYRLKDEFVFSTSLYALYAFAAIGSISLILGIAFNNHRIEYKEKHLLEERLSNLLKPSVFHKLLELEPRIKEDIPITDIAINNPQQEGKRLLIVTNPNCRNCARVHPYIKELSTSIPMSLILIFDDKVGRAVSGTILTAYLQEGWDKAMQLLEEWFEKHEIKEADKYPTTDAAEEMMKGQVMYCWKQNISRTPSAIINGHYLPEVYSLSNLRYVLT